LTIGKNRSNPKTEQSFNVWLKKLREIENMADFNSDSKESRDHIKKMNSLKGLVQNILESHKSKSDDNNQDDG